MYVHLYLNAYMESYVYDRADRDGQKIPPGWSSATHEGGARAVGGGNSPVASPLSSTAAKAGLVWVCGRKRVGPILRLTGYRAMKDVTSSGAGVQTASACCVEWASV